MAGTSAAQLEAENPSLRVITDDIAASLDPDIERKRAQAAEAAWGGGAPATHDASAATAGSADGPADGSTAVSSAAVSGDAAAGDADSGSGAQPAAGAAAGSTGGASGSTVALKEMTDDELEAELRRRQAARGR